MGGEHQAWRVVAVRQLREAAALLRGAREVEAGAWAEWRRQWTRRGRRAAYVALGEACVNVAAARARAWRLAADAHVLGRALGAPSLVLAADATMRRAVLQPVALGGAR
jgi:hypothetical protein